ncbi:polysaccharide biosynthesis tyrosine autokinase [Rhodococcus aetherivorans]|uniref:polysaccharide biosynthesis tyrosine autokinase n=1 Tax=Rhodococcus aetherivorans TaxID=191292 RepID=UPI000622C87D|nr:polysaccharide biosynthesis tyrosine autokinase [Rhodococcus aetherivorans]AKE91307.1 protein tyrosine kinase [Rhodococcus aetherivorans]
MEVHDYLRILQARWKIVAVTTVVAVLGALGASLLTTPIYQASTRLFVSTSSGASVNEIYQGNLFSQQRVASYTKLLTGTTLAQRTLDRLGLSDVTPSQLAGKVTASSAPDTVLVDVKVDDESPERARDLANALSDEFVVMARELETPENGGEPTARVVVEQHADTPVTPVSPKTKRNLALGLAVGVLLGIALAVLRDRLDNTVKDRKTVEELAGTGLVGTIPLDKERQEHAAIDFQESNSGSAEAYREMRTNLKFLDVDNPPRVIVVTSALPAEGKTTTAINTALVLAEAGHSVVLVEGDLRRPRVSKYLGVVGDVGFSTVLSGQAGLEDVLQPSQYEGLWVLASGALPPNPSELLGSETAKHVIDHLRARFEYVIIDGSPVLPVTDSVVLAAATDGALLIARHGKTTREQLSRAVGNLGSAGAHLLGTIITMTPNKGRGAYEYRYYYESDESAKKATAPASTPAPAGSAPVQPGPVAQTTGGRRYREEQNRPEPYRPEQPHRGGQDHDDAQPGQHYRAPQSYTADPAYREQAVPTAVSRPVAPSPMQGPRNGSVVDPGEQR